MSEENEEEMSLEDVIGEYSLADFLDEIDKEENQWAGSTLAFALDEFLKVKEKEEKEMSLEYCLDEFLKQEARDAIGLIIRELFEPQFEYFFFDWCVLEKSFEALD